MDFGEIFTRLSDLVGDAALVAGDDMQVSSRVVTVIRLNHVVEQILFRLSGELDARGIATKNGDGSTARLLQQAGMAPAVALDLDGLVGEKLAAALGPLSRRVPEPDGSADTRTFAQRRADALERLLDTYLAQEDCPTVGGVRPHVAGDP